MESHLKKYIQTNGSSLGIRKISSECCLLAGSTVFYMSFIWSLMRNAAQAGHMLVKPAVTKVGFFLSWCLWCISISMSFCMFADDLIRRIRPYSLLCFCKIRLASADTAARVCVCCAVCKAEHITVHGYVYCAYMKQYTRLQVAVSTVLHEHKKSRKCLL